MIADTFHQLSAKQHLCPCAVSRKKRFLKRLSVRLTNDIRKPFLNRIAVNISDLLIGYRQGQIDIPRLKFLRHRLQVSGEKQKIPEIILILINILIGDLLMYRLFNRSARNQAFNFSPHRNIRSLHKLPDNAVGRRIRPVGLRISISVQGHSLHIIDNAPRIIYLCFPKNITVVPFLRFPQIRFQPKTGKRLPDLFSGKSKVFCIFRI